MSAIREDMRFPAQGFPLLPACDNFNRRKSGESVAWESVSLGSVMPAKAGTQSSPLDAVLLSRSKAPSVLWLGARLRGRDGGNSFATIAGADNLSVAAG